MIIKSEFCVSEKIATKLTKPINKLLSDKRRNCNIAVVLNTAWDTMPIVIVCSKYASK